MWDLDHKEGWALKNWCFWTMVLKKTLESPLDCKEIKPVNPKGNQHSIFIWRTDSEGEAPILWPPDVRSWNIRKDPDAGKEWRQEKTGMTEYEMVGWHQWLNGYEFEQALGDGERQGSLTCCSSWGQKKSDTTDWTATTKNPSPNFKVTFQCSVFITIALYFPVSKSFLVPEGCRYNMWQTQ